MVSPVIKKMLEEKLGRELRYSSDCEYLSYEIENVTKQRVSTNTLKRLLGFIQGVQEPRLYTLDAIARYLGYANWDYLLTAITKDGNSSYTTIEEIECNRLKTGDKVRFEYFPDRMVIVEYQENRRFIVVESRNSKLLTDDIIEVSHFVLNHPLLVSSVIRGDISLGNFIAGKISGLTALSVVE